MENARRSWVDWVCGDSSAGTAKPLSHSLSIPLKGPTAPEPWAPDSQAGGSSASCSMGLPDLSGAVRCFSVSATVWFMRYTLSNFQRLYEVRVRRSGEFIGLGCRCLHSAVHRATIHPSVRFSVQRNLSPPASGSVTFSCLSAGFYASLGQWGHFCSPHGPRCAAGPRRPAILPSPLSQCCPRPVGFFCFVKLFLSFF